MSNENLLNKVIQGDCLDVMKGIEDNSIDLTVTSPPYDNLRKYNGYSFDFESVAQELFRITKDGGVVVWVVGDKVEKGSETLTSFKQALYFKEIGFNVHDTMIYQKNNPMPNKGNRYLQSFEYMFVLSKGKPSTFNPIMLPCKYANHSTKPSKWSADGVLIKGEKRVINEFKKHGNIFGYSVGNTGTRNTKHPAVFPEKLAEEQIISWSNEGDVIFDPFMGSGTTAKMAILNNRNFIGSEISEEYCEIANKRIEDALSKKEGIVNG